MSTDRTCNSSLWTKEEDKIFEDTLAIYYGDNLLEKLEEALPGKSCADIRNHYEILLDDVEAIECGRVPLPKYPEMQSHSNQKSRFSKTDLQWRRGVAWTEEEHRSFLWGLAEYGRSDWRSISRHCVISRTPSQVASHAQKYFNRLKAANKENRRASILDITSVGAETAGTSQVQNTENMIWPACGGSQAVASAVASTSNGSMFFRESTNAEQVKAVAGGESSCHNAAFVNGMNCPYPDENDEFILHIDDLIVDPEDVNGSRLLVDAGRSLLPSKQPCTAASTETHSDPITTGSELDALIAAYMDEGNDTTSIFYAGKAPTSHAMLSNASHSGMCSYPVANIAPQNTPAARSGICSYPVASFGANSAPQSTMAAHSGVTSFAVACVGANNAPQNMVAAHSRMTSFTGIGANNAPRNTGAAHRGMVSFGAASIGAYNAPQTTLPAHTSFGVASIGAYNAPQTAVSVHRRMASFAVGGIGANTAPQNTVADHSRMTSFAVASFGANNATPNTVAAHRGMTSSAVARIGANNAPWNMTSFAVANFGAINATQNTVASYAQLPPVAPSSNSSDGGWPNLNTTINDEGILDLDDLF